MLKNLILFGIALTLIVLITAFMTPSTNHAYETDPITNAPVADEARYIGVAACVMCHRTEQQGRQEAIWKESAHARAFETLKSEESVKIAKEMGIEKPPHEAPECLVCHATGWDLPPERLDARFKIEDGVQCETCHGAGSEYRAIHARNLELGIERGLIVGRGDADACIACHNEKSPTYKGFDFERDMAEIAHPVPK